MTDRRPIWQSNLLQTGPVLIRVLRATGTVYTVDMVMTERVRGHQHSRDPFQAGVQ